MTNYADIQFTANLKSVMANTLERKASGTYYGRETENGLKMAIAYLDSIDAEMLTDQQLRHAVRLSNYRGKATDYRALHTA